MEKGREGVAAFAKRILSTRPIPSFRQIIMCLTSSLILVPLWITDGASHCDWAEEKILRRGITGRSFLFFWNKVNLIPLNVNATKQCFQWYIEALHQSFFSSLCTIINLLRAFLFYSHKFSTRLTAIKKNLMQWHLNGIWYETIKVDVYLI